ncbi:hypothetical protein [Xenorhabdus sp. KJ12.1]|nr:hypothetical protein [Xenorhabdus sp. KJ12.1]
MLDGTSMLARPLLTVREIQGVTFRRFTAESDAAATASLNPDRHWPD